MLTFCLAIAVPISAAGATPSNRVEFGQASQGSAPSIDQFWNWSAPQMGRVQARAHFDRGVVSGLSNLGSMAV
jgi:hypothetical protein